MTLLASPNDAEMLQELLKTARVTTAGVIELQIRAKIRVLREEQQAALLALVEGGHHRRPEESPTNKMYEARITELEDVVSDIDFYKESYLWTLTLRTTLK